jgi:Raf kinase inhibitor-like YbhB/YbcL family protein
MPPPETSPPITNAPGVGGPVLATDVFPDGGDIPVAFTCDGENEVPGLRITDVPEGTTSLALTVIDPDGGDWIHWVSWNIPPDIPAFGPNVPPGDLPDGTRQGANDFAQVLAAGEPFPGGGEVRIDGWDGPCPPPGDPHRYVFTLYALTGTIDLPSGTPGADILAAIEDARANGSLIGEHSITGLYPPG